MDLIALKQLKIEVLNYCQQHISQKIAQNSTELASLRQINANDTKSSMGDKYETSREMMQQEMNRILQIKAQNEMQLQQINWVIQHFKGHDRISNGSLVLSDSYCFLIGAALGKVMVQGKEVYVVSNSAPMATLLLGKRKKDVFEFQDKKVTIIDIV